MFTNQIFIQLIIILLIVAVVTTMMPLLCWPAWDMGRSPYKRGRPEKQALKDY